MFNQDARQQTRSKGDPVATEDVGQGDVFLKIAGDVSPTTSPEIPERQGYKIRVVIGLEDWSCHVFLPSRARPLPESGAGCCISWQL